MGVRIDRNAQKACFGSFPGNRGHFPGASSGADARPYSPCLAENYALGHECKDRLLQIQCDEWEALKAVEIDPLKPLPALVGTISVMSNVKPHGLPRLTLPPSKPKTQFNHQATTDVQRTPAPLRSGFVQTSPFTATADKRPDRRSRRRRGRKSSRAGHAGCAWSAHREWSRRSHHADRGRCAKSR